MGFTIGEDVLWRLPEFEIQDFQLLPVHGKGGCPCLYPHFRFRAWGCGQNRIFLK